MLWRVVTDGEARGGGAILSPRLFHVRAMEKYRPTSQAAEKTAAVTVWKGVNPRDSYRAIAPVFVA